MSSTEAPVRSWLRIGGVPVVTPWSSLLGMLLVAWLFAPVFASSQRSTGAALAMAGVFAALIYLSILLHELAHAAAARHYGYPVHRIELHVLGGWTTYERARSTPGRELVIALVGPLTTLAIAVVALAGSRLAGDLWPGAVEAGQLLGRLALVSVFIGVYNLLPGLPLDGGALVKCGVWRLTGVEARGTVAGGYAGLGVAAFVLSVPFLVSALAGAGAPDPGSVILAAVFGAWLGAGAVSALRRGKAELLLADLSVASLVRPAFAVGGDVSLAEAQRRAGGPAARIVVIDPMGRPLGVVQDAAALAVPAERAAWVSVSSLSRGLDSPVALPSELDGRVLLQALADHPAVDHLVTGPGGEVVGVLATADVERALGG